MHTYSIQIGRDTFHAYGDDVYARRVAARWLRLVLPHRTDVGLFPTCSIRRSPRLYEESGVVRAGPWPMIESFELSEIPIAEFVRVYDPPRRAPREALPRAGARVVEDLGADHVVRR